uniref:Uncharacterized protein n=1 Tax=viral metagenome TaxID=1070528 RepID=A0A6M3K6B1_9ZZZZ
MTIINTTEQLLKDSKTKLVITLPSGEYSTDIDRILKAPLQELIDLIPDKIYLTSTIADIVRQEARIKKENIDTRTSQLYLTLRKSAKDSGEKVTEDHLKNLIATDKQLVDWRKEMNELIYYKERLQSALNTIYAKKDLLELALGRGGIADPFTSNLVDNQQAEQVLNPRQPAINQPF